MNITGIVLHGVVESGEQRRDNDRVTFYSLSRT